MAWNITIQSFSREQAEGHGCGGELPPLVGQVVAVAVGNFSDEAMIAQEAKLAAAASGDLLFGAADTPSCIVKHVA
jgi:hypothetical protein